MMILGLKLSHLFVNMLHNLQRKFTVLNQCLTVVKNLKLIECGDTEGSRGRIQQRCDLIVKIQMTSEESALAIS